MISKSYMLRLPSTLFSCQSWEYIYFLKLEMIFMDEFKKWIYISGRNNEDKYSRPSLHLWVIC